MRFFKKKKIIVIMYHSFTSGKDDKYKNVTIDANTFEKQMMHLKRYYNVMPLEEIIIKLKNGKKIPGNSVALTFDDGYKSNYTLAYPILKKYDFHATIFLVTDYIDTGRWLWVNELEYILNRTKVETISMPLEDEKIYLNLESPESKMESYIKLKERLKKMSPILILQTMKFLNMNLGVSIEQADIENYKMLSWDDIFSMDKQYVDFGCHTATHPILPMIKEKKILKREIVGAKNELEKKMKKPVQLFCYPNGDFNEESVSLIKKHYLAAISTRPGYIGSKYDLYDIPRIAASSQDIKEFIWAMVRYN